MEQKVNWNFKNYFLTYAQANCNREELVEFLRGRFNEYGIRRWVCATEHHKDGGIHFHAVFCLLTKLHTRDCRKFDFNGLHPNVKSAPTPDDLYYYVTKEGNYTGEWEELVVPQDFRKRRADIDAFKLEKESKALGSPFPFELPNEVLVEKMAEEKKRHFWFVAKADWGKTHWVNETFAGKQVYLRPPAKYPYEGYLNEPIIIFDDVTPDGKDELCAITNTWRIKCQVYGDTRYTRKYWNIGSERLVIILSNIDSVPKYEYDQWFINRFTVVYL